MSVQNEPIYNGVPLGKLIDKPIYASGVVEGVDGLSKKIYTFKKGDYIGSLFSWSNIGNNTYLMFYRTKADYVNFKPFYIKLSSPTSAPDLQKIKDEIKAAELAKANETKTTLEIYIEKYAPWVIGALVVSIALPSVLNSVRSKSMGAISKNKGLLMAGGAALLLMSFRKKKSKNSVVLGPVVDVTDWKQNEVVSLPVKIIEQPRSNPRIFEPVVKYDEYYPTVEKPRLQNEGATIDYTPSDYGDYGNKMISGTIKKISNKYTC
jgi:hypothetical protein